MPALLRPRGAALYGGQAVIEGVMMRGPERMAVAVRQPDGAIVVHEEAVGRWAERLGLGRWPLLGGLVTLAESLSLGLAALMFSANAASEPDERLTRGEMRWTVAIATVVAVGVFVVLPTWLVGLLAGAFRSSVALNLVEGTARVAILVAYLYGISRTREMQRVLGYHGAEHKAIAALEAGARLAPETVRAFPRFHPRCGTSYLLFVAFVALVLFTAFGWPSFIVRVVSRIVGLPLVAALAYELLRASARRPGALWARCVQAPGLWMQRLTTREPDEGQLEVAIAALEAVRRAERPLAQPAAGEAGTA